MLEKIIRIGTAVLLLNDEGKVLMGKRHGSHGSHTWALIGGYIEFGETFEAAAAREVMEEVGVTIKDIRVLKAVPYFFEENNKKQSAAVQQQSSSPRRRGSIGHWINSWIPACARMTKKGVETGENFKHHISIYMTARIDQGVPTICEPHKMLELRFVDWNDLPQPTFVPYHEDITVKLVQGL